MKVFCILSGLLCALCVLPFTPSYLWVAVPFMFFLCVFLLVFGAKEGKTLASVVFILLLSFILHRVLYLKQCGQFNAPCDKSTVVFLEGVLSGDSSYSESGTLVLRLVVKKVGDSYANTFEGFPGGLQVVALAKERALICAGTRVHLTGHFSGNLFICESVKVVGKGFLNHIREALVLLLEKRLSLNSLGMLLLLGRAEDLPQRITETAVTSGCIHVLALSGMHLNFLADTVQRIFGKNRFSKVFSAILIIVFVFIAGPRPSLIRAALMFFFSFLGTERAVCLSFMLQLILTPFVFLNSSNAFGYLAVFALMTISPYIHWNMRSYLGQHLGGLISSTTGVLILSAPLQLALNGCWYPQAILAGPVAVFLVLFAMTVNLFVVILGPLSFLLNLNSIITDLLSSLFSFSSSLGSASFLSYLVFLFVMLLFPVVCRIYERL